MDTIDWLLDSDPAIRWQAMRDLTDASREAVAAERARVPREGVGPYDVLRALDYFRDAGVRPDARVGDALHVVENRQQADRRWLFDRGHDEALAFPFGESVGEPGRWNTLRALRVPRWHERARLEPASSPRSRARA